MTEALSPEVLAALDRVFARWDGTDGPGLGIGVAIDGRVAFRRDFGYASIEQQTPIAPNTRFRIASTSKHFTALAALMIAGDGNIDIDAPIGDYIPELRGRIREASIRLLLHHRGGARCHIDLGHHFHGEIAAPVGSALDLLASPSLGNFAPGRAMLYSNGGYHLVSLALERVTGQRFEDLLAQRLFAPVGMASTLSLPSDYLLTPHMAAMHVACADGAWRRGLFASHEFKGEGAIVSTVDDMLRWCAFLRPMLLAEEGSVRELLVAPRGTEPCGPIQYGLGLMIEERRGIRAIHHAGNVAGSASQMLIAPDQGIDVVILSNGARGADPAALANDVIDVLLKDEMTPRVNRRPSSTDDGWCGHYGDRASGMVYSVSRDDGGLHLAICGHPSTIPLEQREDALWAFSKTLSPIRLIGLPKTGAISITFGDETQSFSRIAASTSPMPDFDGIYVCPEIDCAARVFHDDEQVLCCFRGRFGEQLTCLSRLGENFTFSVARHEHDLHRAALYFEPGAGPRAQFRFNSMRTRGLTFERVAASTTPSDGGLEHR